MRIAICEDNNFDMDFLSGALEKYFALNNETVSINKFVNGNDFINTFYFGLYDIVFLDIFIGSMTGIEIAEKIRCIDKNCFIIFTTTSPDFAVEGFRVNASHYLLKPLKDIDIVNALERVCSFNKQNLRFFEIKVGGILKKIIFINVKYVEVLGKICIIKTIDEDFQVRLPLSNIKTLLDSKYFLQCHRSFIVNLQHVVRMDSEHFIIGNDKIPIGRSMAKQSKDAYSEYLFSLVRGIDNA